MIKKILFIIFICFIYDVSFAREDLSCKVFGQLELIVAENRISEMTKEEQINLVEKVNMSPRDRIISRKIVEDVYTINDFNMPISEIRNRGRKICEEIKNSEE